VFDNRPPDFVAQMIKKSTSPCTHAKYVFLEETPSKNAYEGIVRAYRQNGVVLAPNPRYDEMGAMYTANQMFIKRQIVLHENMTEAKRQFSLWSKDGGIIKKQGFWPVHGLVQPCFYAKRTGSTRRKSNTRGYTRTPPARDGSAGSRIVEKVKTDKVVGMGDMFG